MGKQTIQQSAHRYGKKRECIHPGCDWTAHTGICCGRHKELENKYKAEAEKVDKRR